MVAVFASRVCVREVMFAEADSRTSRCPTTVLSASCIHGGCLLSSASVGVHHLHSCDRRGRRVALLGHVEQLLVEERSATAAAVKVVEAVEAVNSKIRSKADVSRQAALKEGMELRSALSAALKEEAATTSLLADVEIIQRETKAKEEVNTRQGKR